MFAFFALLRLREYCDGRLLFSHVAKHEWGIQLTVPFSKTSLQPQHIRLTIRGDHFCPVRAYDAYVSLIHPSLRLHSTSFFRASPSTTAPHSAASFVRDFKLRVAVHLQLNSAPYAGHSFRRGGTTALFMAGVSETVIAKHGRWRSDVYKHYFDFDSRQQLLPTQLLLLHSQQQPH